MGAWLQTSWRVSTRFSSVSMILWFKVNWEDRSEIAWVWAGLPTAFLISICARLTWNASYTLFVSSEVSRNHIPSSVISPSIFSFSSSRPLATRMTSLFASPTPHKRLSNLSLNFSRFAWVSCSRIRIEVDDLSIGVIDGALTLFCGCKGDEARDGTLLWRRWAHKVLDADDLYLWAVIVILLFALVSDRVVSVFVCAIRPAAGSWRQGGALAVTVSDQMCILTALMYSFCAATQVEPKQAAVVVDSDEVVDTALNVVVLKATKATAVF